MPPLPLPARESRSFDLPHAWHRRRQRMKAFFVRILPLVQAKSQHTVFIK
jgi:hypothetical protein